MLKGSLKTSLLTVEPSDKFRRFLETIKFEKPVLRLDDLVSIQKMIQDRGLPKVYFHELLENSYIRLPENEMIQRNPELDARCVKLSNELLNRDYRKATRSISSVRERSETVAFQIKEINKYMWATVQVFISVMCCFLFGFFGLDLAKEEVTTDARITSGVICGFITLVAEMYFFIKKVEYFSV